MLHRTVRDPQVLFKGTPCVVRIPAQCRARWAVPGHTTRVPWVWLSPPTAHYSARRLLPRPSGPLLELQLGHLASLREPSLSVHTEEKLFLTGYKEYGFQLHSQMPSVVLAM